MSNVYGNLSNQFPDIAAMSSSTLVNGNTPLTTLKDNVNHLQTNLNTVQSQSNVILGHQTDMTNIVSDEQSRLVQKKMSVDNAYSSQLRAIYMNDNIQKRYNAYLKIIVAFVIGASVVFAISFLSTKLPIPPMAITAIYIIVLSGVMIYSIIVYSEIQKHERLDYDRLYVKPLTSDSYDASGGEDDSSYNFYFCQNEHCCVSGSTTFDISLGKCVKVEHFENMYPSEYTSYAPY